MERGTLLHHDAPDPVSGLARLLSTDLRHNPLSTHPRHREIASSWLHPALASLGPSLDTVPLSRSELLHVGSSRLIVSPSVSPARPVSGDQDQEAALATLYSLEADFPESVSAVGSREGSTVSGFTLSGRTQRRRRRGHRKVREAVINHTEATGTATTRQTEVAGDKKTDDNEKYRLRYGCGGQDKIPLLVKVYSGLGFQKKDQKRKDYNYAVGTTAQLNILTCQHQDHSVDPYQKHVLLYYPLIIFFARMIVLV